MVVSALTYCTLLHSMWDFKAPQMNMQYSLIQKLLLYKFEMGNNVVEDICFAKGEGTDDHSTITR